MKNVIKCKTTATITMTVDELIDGLEGDLSPIVAMLESKGYEVTKKEPVNEDEKIIHAICDRFGLSYYTDKDTVLQLFKTEILNA